MKQFKASVDVVMNEEQFRDICIMIRIRQDSILICVLIPSPCLSQKAIQEANKELKEETAKEFKVSADGVDGV